MSKIVKQATAAAKDPPGTAASRPAGNPLLATLLGSALAVGFYGIVLVVPWGPLRRYFLGHPVAVAATILFCFAIAVLIAKLLGIISQSSQLAALRDSDLQPPATADSPADRWRWQTDAGHVARTWLASLGQLPAATRHSQLVCRLTELLQRQSQRGSSKHLADDLRELAARDADAVHDSFGFVRIVVWAIPMLGFLGTVIGITQTLGNLDFSNGTAAVDSLKSGLYVAFDTTALGLVLSVVAIFIQFPIERSEQQLVAEIDARVGRLLSAGLPGDEASDNQTVLIADLCRGVQAAVAESLANQTKLWRETIDEARGQWQTAHDEHANQFASALQQNLLPALTDHATVISASAKQASERIDRQWQRCEESIHYHADTLTTQQLELTAQFEALTDAHERAGSVIALQRAIESNLQQLGATNTAIEHSVQAAAAGGMADAMKTLARAVDVLSARLAAGNGTQHQPHGDRARRAA